MNRTELTSMFKSVIDSDFTICCLLGAEIMDHSLFTLFYSTESIDRVNISNQKIGTSVYSIGYFSGYKVTIDPNMKINDYRLIKDSGEIVDLRDHGIEYYFDPNKRIRDNRNKKIDQINRS